MNLTRELSGMAARAKAAAHELGLDPPEVVFELVDPDELNMVASYGGFPVRYPHWRFGMEFQQLQKHYEYGLSRIYELVINSDPCYAYLMKTNTLMEQMLVMAHVYGHADFFRNNLWFQPTDRKMVDVMANHGTRVRRHVDRYGAEQVERFLDFCLSLENLIDPMSMYVRRESAPEPAPDMHEDRYARSKVTRFPTTSSYMEPYMNPKSALEEERKRLTAELAVRRRRPHEPTADVLRFLLDNAPLEDWQADCLDIVHEEAYYFAPQKMTKVINEGWATFVHSRLMTTKLLAPSEVVNYCEKHAGTLASAPGQINPYRLGYALLRDIEDRWNRGAHGREWRQCEDSEERRRWDTGAMEGMRQVFHVRRVHNDQSFLDAFVTPQFIEQEKLFTYGRDPRTGQTVILDRDPVSVKRKLVEQFTNMGQPIIEVEDANFENRGELLLIHRYEGTPLREDYAMETLRSLQALWSRPVHIRTMAEDKPILWSHDGDEAKTRDL